jgi:hypothetical protein
MPTGCLHMRFRTCSLPALLAASLSCAPSEPQNRRAEVFTEHRFLKAAVEAPKKQLGEDCFTYGASECQSDLCFHVGADPAKGHVCSKACESDDECPQDWTCRSVYPTPGSSFCVPPRDWAPRAIIARQRAWLGTKAGKHRDD